MTYSAPRFRRFTLYAPSLSLPPLVMGQSDRGQLLAQIEERGGAQANGKTVLGGTILEGTNYKPYYFWQFNYKCSSENDVALLKEYAAQLQADPELQIVLDDEFYFCTATESLWHNRTRITGSSRTKGGITVWQCSYNVWLSVVGAWWEPLPPGWGNLQFTCEEII